MGLLSQKIFDGLYCDACSLLIRKAKFSGRNTAERHAFQSFLRRQFQTGPIAGSQLLPVMIRYPKFDDRANSVQDILAGQIKCRSDFCLPGWLRISLPFHQLLAGKPQFHTGIGMNGVVNTAVIRDIATGHPGICRVYNGVAAQGRNIALPKIYARLNRRHPVYIGNALCGYFILQVFVLHFQKIRPDMPGSANVHQSS